MNSNEAYAVALKIADLYLKALQFFIAICTLFGGWIVVNGLPPEENVRALLAVIFLTSSGTLLLGQLHLLKRSSAALALSAQCFEKEHGDIEPAVAPLFATGATKFDRFGTLIGMGGVIVAIVCLIFLAKIDDESKKATETQEIAAISTPVFAVCVPSQPYLRARPLTACGDVNIL